MRLPGIIFLGLSLPCSPVFADEYAFSFGSEYFSWREYDESGPMILEETGPRSFIALDATNAPHDRWNFGFHGRMYGAEVRYDGALQDANRTSWQTTVRYRGASVELDLVHRLSTVTTGSWSLQQSVGVEQWSRNLLGPGGYEETYQVRFLRFGALYDNPRLQLRAGVKLPYHVREKVLLKNRDYSCGTDCSYVFLDNLALRPGEALSLYAKANVRLNERWYLTGYYDSYRFRRSPSSSATVLINGTVSSEQYYVQPESHQDTLGMVVGYRF